MLWMLLACPKPTSTELVEGFVGWPDGVWRNEAELPCSHEVMGALVVQDWIPNKGIEFYSNYAWSCQAGTHCWGARDELRRRAITHAVENGGDAVIEGGFAVVARRLTKQDCQEIDGCEMLKGYKVMDLYTLMYTSTAIRWWSSSCLEDRRPREDTPETPD